MNGSLIRYNPVKNLDIVIIRDFTRVPLPFYHVSLTNVGFAGSIPKEKVDESRFDNDASHGSICYLYSIYSVFELLQYATSIVLFYSYVSGVSLKKSNMGGTKLVQ